MTEHTHISHHPSDHDEHASHGGLGKYLAVAATLMILTIGSFLVANSPLMETPLVGWLVMMAISVTKAMLVILFFMHLVWEANWKYVLTIPASIMAVLLVVALVPDIYMRYHQATPERLLHAAVVPEAKQDIFEITEGELGLGAEPQMTPGRLAQPGDQYIEIHDEQPAGDSH